jgi:hypothetical protein
MPRFGDLQQDAAQLIDGAVQELSLLGSQRLRSIERRAGGLDQDIEVLLPCLDQLLHLGAGSLELVDQFPEFAQQRHGVHRLVQHDCHSFACGCPSAG